MHAAHSHVHDACVPRRTIVPPPNENSYMLLITNPCAVFSVTTKVAKALFACASLSVCLPPTSSSRRACGSEDARKQGGSLMMLRLLPFQWEGIVVCCSPVGGSSQAPFPPHGLQPKLQVAGAVFPPEVREVANSMGDGAGCSKQSLPDISTGLRTSANLETGKPE